MISIIIAVLSGLIAGSVAVKVIDTQRLWEKLIAFVIGMSFVGASVYVGLSATGTYMLERHDDTEMVCETVEIAAVTLRDQDNGGQPIRIDSEGRLTSTGTSNSRGQYSYVELATGEVHDVPARGTATLIGDYDTTTLTIRSERFTEGTFMYWMFGDSETVRDRVFRIREGAIQ